MYVSFGTIYHSRAALLQHIAQGLARLDVNVVLAAPSLPPEMAAALPENCTWLRLADQLAALRRADVFVTHGGHSSFLEAMRLGVPMLVLPLASDQPNQAFFAEHHGVGQALDLALLDAAMAAQVVVEMLEDRPMRAAIERFSTLYEQRVGAERAVGLIEERLGLAGHGG